MLLQKAMGLVVENRFVFGFIIYTFINASPSQPTPCRDLRLSTFEALFYARAKQFGFPNGTDLVVQRGGW